MLSNAKHEHFAQLIARDGKNKSEAARIAGYAEKTAGVSGCKLAKLPQISARIKELQSRTEERITHNLASAITVDRIWIIQKLVEIVTKCTSEKRYNPSAATKSLELLGKDLGMFRDYIRIEVFTEKMARMGEVVAKYCDADTLELIASGWEAIANELPAPVNQPITEVQAVTLDAATDPESE